MLLIRIVIKKEYQRKYYLRNREQISNIRAEYYINKLRERNKNFKKP